MIKLGGIFDLESKISDLQKLKEQISDPAMWENNSESTTVMKKISFLEKDISLRKNLVQKAEDVEVLFEFLNENQVEEEEVKKELDTFSNLLREFELKLILNGDNDSNDAIITIHPGAGGTESQDWAEMLYRMYSMWAESKGFKFNVIDFQNGDEAGLKDCTVEISGDYAYGLLQAEIGIHRLVRISPFDSNSRRHTSFASVSVSPAVNEDIDIEINQKDLRVDTFRSSGAGGQHVNKTDSAIRITHIPSGIVTQCQTQRSQHKNKEQALKVLKSKLFQLEMEKQLLNKKELEGEKKDIGWGSQIRSYVFHPYNMIKDHRTKHEVGNIKSVMDGNIDDFIYSYLLDKMEKNK
ncbi:peptide chain release factor 2 [Candidatus Marinimicrobia bacterium]|nr:peptide chain release factor 2 [Candidatus Neomarinimicrobiota bacterium]MDA9735873.1 peptide chain release factor 2 [Candidatus Neomarinimicrobiota bacterium]